MNFKNTPHKSIVMFSMCFFFQTDLPLVEKHVQCICIYVIYDFHLWLLLKFQGTKRIASVSAITYYKTSCVKDSILFAERRKNNFYTNICLCTLLFHKKHIFIFSFAILLFHLFLFFVSRIHWENIEHYVDGFCHCFRYFFFLFALSKSCLLDFHCI